MPSVQLGPPRDVKIAKVGRTHIELTWLAPVGSVTGYRVSGRHGGEGFFVALIEDTGDASCGARVPVKPGCWWELRVAAFSEGMAGAESKLTQPMMTKGGESRGESHRQAQGGDKPGRRGSRRRRSSTRASAAEAEDEPLSDEGAKGPVEPSAAELLEAEYARVKREIRVWEEAFAQAHGHPASELERAASPRYRKAAQSYARLRKEQKASQAGRPGRNPMHPGRNPMHPGRNPMHPGRSPMHPGRNPTHPLCGAGGAAGERGVAGGAGRQRRDALGAGMGAGGEDAAVGVRFRLRQRAQADLH